MVEQVHGAQWRKWVEQNQAVIIDVREPFEWSQGTLPDSELIPLASLAQMSANLDKRRPALMVCRSGNRSQHAALLLKHLGFDRVANLAGGVLALGMAA